MTQIRKYDLVVIGGSNGSMEVVEYLLNNLPSGFEIPIVIVLHRLRNVKNLLKQVLEHHTRHAIKEPLDKESIQPGYIYLAVPNYHLMIEKDKTFSYSYSEPVNYSRPSISVLFETAADVYGEHLAAILLTGANADGASGIERIKDKGGFTIAQDPKTAKSAYMPQAAINTGKTDCILTVTEIIATLKKINNDTINAD